MAPKDIVSCRELEVSGLHTASSYMTRYEVSGNKSVSLDPGVSLLDLRTERSNSVLF